MKPKQLKITPETRDPNGTGAALSKPFGLSGRPNGTAKELLDHPESVPGWWGRKILKSKSFSQEVAEAERFCREHDRTDTTGRNAMAELDEAMTGGFYTRLEDVVTGMQERWVRPPGWLDMMIDTGCDRAPSPALFVHNQFNPDATMVPTAENLLSDPGRESGILDNTGTELVYIEHPVLAAIAAARVLRSMGMNAYVALNENDTETQVVAVITGDRDIPLRTFSIEEIADPSRRLDSPGIDSADRLVRFKEGQIVPGMHPSMQFASLLTGKGEMAVEYAMYAHTLGLTLARSVMMDVRAWKESHGDDAGTYFKPEDMSDESKRVVQEMAAAANEADNNWPSIPYLDGAIETAIRLIGLGIPDLCSTTNPKDAKNTATGILGKVINEVETLRGKADFFVQRTRLMIRSINERWDVEATMQAVYSEVMRFGGMD